MAHKELISFRSGQFWGVNTTYKIGPHADNGPADVMLVQTLFRYLSYASENTKSDLGYTEGDLPQATGKFDGKTAAIISKFQRKNAAKLLSADGSIHPASYSGRVIRSVHWDPLLARPRQQVMTITLLHIYAWYAASIFDTTGNYVSKLAMITPELRSWLFP
ncbi:MAG: peptidoglycan-binding protein [Pyrinomonadaceae bacterium]